MAATKKETAEKVNQMSDLYIDGRIVRAYFGETRKDHDEKYRLTIHGEIPYDEITAYEDTRASFIPTWFKDREGYMNLSSVYDIPCRYNRETFKFSEWISDGFDLTPVNATVCVRVRQKEGAVYPVAIDILSDGEVADVWEGFDSRE